MMIEVDSTETSKQLITTWCRNAKE